MSGGAKKQTVGYAYALGMHLVLCHGPIDKVIEIQADEKQAFLDGSWTGGIRYVSAFELFGGMDREGGIAGNFNLMMGYPTQGVDPYLSAKLPGAPGRPIPAYRGVVSMVLQQVYIGNSVYVKKLAFKASRIHVRTTDGITQWYDAKAEIGGRPDGGVSSGAFIIAGTAGSNIVFFNEKITDTWNNDTSTSAPISNPNYAVSAGDKYLLFNSYEVYSTVDGVDFAYVGTHYPYVTGGAPLWEPTLGPKGRIIIGRSGGLLTSVDKGETWTLSVTPTTFNAVIKCAGIYIGLFSPSQHWWSANDPLTNESWVDNGSQADQFLDGARAGVSNGTIAMIGGIDPLDTDIPAIVQTGDGATFVPQVMPLTGLLGNSPISMVWGGDRWGCLINGTQFQVIYKTTVGSAWIIGLTLPSGVTAYRLSHIANYFVLGTSAGSKYSTNLFDWLDVPGTDSISPTDQPRWYVDGVATGHSPDMNPAHIIRECLTDPDWGMGYLDSDIDDDSFVYAADVLYAEYFGLSLLWNSQTTIDDFIKEVIKHIDASLYVDRKTGKFKLKLIRHDYEIDGLISLNPSNIEHVADFTRPTFGELTNSLTVKFWNSETDKDDGVTVQDIALAQMQNATINTTITYAGITKADLATRIAQRDLTTISTPIVSCTLYCDRTASDLDIGDAFLLTWPDYQLDNIVMRATAVAYGNGNKNMVRVSCTQDVYTTPDVPIIAPPSGEWIDINQPPLPAVDRIPYEVPYMEAIQQYGQTAIDNQLTTNNEIGYVGLALGRPTSDTINANLYVNSGGGYVLRDTVDFSPSCKLAVDVGKTDTAFNVGSATQIETAIVGSWLQIDDELMAFVSFTDPVLTVRRGLFDTVPADHATGALALFWDSYPANDPTQYAEGDTLLLKATTVTIGGELALADAPIDSVTMASRMIRPYAPGQFKINGIYYPDALTGALAVTWAHRDRLLQTGGVYLDTTAGSIGPEPGTTYTIRYYNDDTSTLLNTESGISGTAGSSWTPSADANLRVELESVRDGFVSWQTQSSVFSWVSDFSNSGDIAWTEASDTFALTGLVDLSAAIAWTESDDVFAIVGFIDISGSLAWTESSDVFLAEDSSGSSPVPVFVDEFDGSVSTALDTHTPVSPAGAVWGYAPDMTLDGSGAAVNLNNNNAYSEANIPDGSFAQANGVYWEFTATIGQSVGGDKHSVCVISMSFDADTPRAYIYINGPDSTYGGSNPNKIIIGYDPAGEIVDLGTNPYSIGDTVTVRCEIDPTAQTITFLLDGESVHVFDTSAWYFGDEPFAPCGLTYSVGTTAPGDPFAAPGVTSEWLRVEAGTLS